MSRFSQKGWRLLAGLLVTATVTWSVPAPAAPQRIVLVRHGEKGGPWTLCQVGRDRARALATYYLGKDAQKSAFRPGETPKAILAISLHTLETVFPAADSWQMPVVFYAAMPEMVDGRFVLSEARLSQRTREAARDILEKPEWAGQTLLLYWEHDHVARTSDDPEGTEHKSTLYDQLGLGALTDVPRIWPDNTYDYIWFIDFDQKTGKPISFSMMKEEFGAPFEDLPQNDWGQPEGLKPSSGCILP
ncbi:hypothetical protein EZH22_20910 [Xanthobacter dioxanivorans]|uniref:Histidine phosphatase family protein n=1 Tax=Xanthobacter dioxanivorans TaxID=2528964 RepID=A0A974SIN0_9HYPH|nr:hypothetical protein [Xanthobacter dioxanivorans]QRG05513.1 hypothetical protein EZH22_20910 [Xanthobacter dioxanivorans]